MQELNEYGQTLLHEAISHHQGDYALFLLEKGIKVQQADYQGATALHFATYYRLADVTARILEHHGNPNAADEHGNTPLWTAVFSARGHYQVVQLLVDAGADPTPKTGMASRLWTSPSKSRTKPCNGCCPALDNAPIFKRSAFNVVPFS